MACVNQTLLVSQSPFAKPICAELSPSYHRASASLPSFPAASTLPSLLSLFPPVLQTTEEAPSTETLSAVPGADRSQTPPSSQTELGPSPGPAQSPAVPSVLPPGQPPAPPSTQPPAQLPVLTPVPLPAQPPSQPNSASANAAASCSSPGDEGSQNVVRQHLHQQTVLHVVSTEEELGPHGAGELWPEAVPGSMGDSEEKQSQSPRSSSSECLQTLALKEHYEVERELGRGTYGKVVLARCRHTGTQVALKLLPKTSTKLRDFQREVQLSYFLSPHANIIDTYNVAFQTKSSYVFAQEHAPLGDLFDAIPPHLGMREEDAKSVVKQLASALDFMHSKHLVHRDIKPENVLVMATDFSRVKLMDFGMTRKQGTMVRKTNGSIPYTPPEICEAVRNESILVTASADVWALAVLLFCMLTGNFPWENADIGDVYFKEFVLWQRRKTPKLPSQWRHFTPRAMKFFRKALDLKPERRCAIAEMLKYVSDAWTQKARGTDSDEDSGTSSSEPLDELAVMLQDHGIETRVDRRLRERRISEWLLSL